MIRTTQKEIKKLAARYTDITHCNNNDRDVIIAREGWLDQIAYSAGVYGCNGVVYRGNNTGEIYVIADRTSALYIFG